MKMKENDIFWLITRKGIEGKSFNGDNSFGDSQGSLHFGGHSLDSRGVVDPTAIVFTSMEGEVTFSSSLGLSWKSTMPGRFLPGWSRVVGDPEGQDCDNVELQNSWVELSKGMAWKEGTLRPQTIMQKRVEGCLIELNNWGSAKHAFPGEWKCLPGLIQDQCKVLKRDGNTGGLTSWSWSAIWKFEETGLPFFMLEDRTASQGSFSRSSRYSMTWMPWDLSRARSESITFVKVKSAQMAGWQIQSVSFPQQA